MTGRALLLTELEYIVDNCCRLLSMVQTEHLTYRPQENMRTMAELMNHLAQIPAVDLKIMRGASEEEVVEIEQSLGRDETKSMCEVMKQGAEDLSRFMQRLSLDDFENGAGMAFYGRTQTYSQWLLEAVTHIFHHRSQLFTYLKLNGYDVSTRDLYSK
jgi:uncharacterized damage-inducible protein DinB